MSKLFEAASANTDTLTFIGASTAPALIVADQTVTFAHLRQLVDQVKPSVKPGEVLVAARSVEFVVRLLAHLESRTPAAVIASRLSPDQQSVIKEEMSQRLHPDCCLVLFTSGSSGAIKGVQLSSASLLANTRAVIEAIDFAEAAEQTLFLPLSYSFGLLGQLLPALALGMPTRLASFSEVTALLSAGRIRGLVSGVPSHFEILLASVAREHCAAVTHVVSAGAHLTSDLRRRMVAHFSAATVYNNYGLTEAGPRVASIRSSHPDFFREGVVGVPVRGIEVATSDAGELLVAGSQVMLGYLGEEALNGQWLRTGDVATIDEKGIIQILDRQDDLSKIGGERVSLRAVRAALLQLSHVSQAAVLHSTDSVYGGRIAAFLVADERLVRDKLFKELKVHLAGAQIPSEFFQVDSLPVAESGKLQANELRRLQSETPQIL